MITPELRNRINNGLRKMSEDALWKVHHATSTQRWRHVVGQINVGANLGAINYANRASLEEIYRIGIVRLGQYRSAFRALI